uniref:Cortactin n=1 Tax=Hucho hucho TaxID=62062 RepID=A0A4W5MUD0_9TELE
MWKAAAGQSVTVAVDDGGDDWETDPDFENDVSEKEQRWGAKTVEGSGHQEHINIHKLRENVSSEHSDLRQKEQATMPKASDGYGGKFGVQQDRMDKSAVGHEYQSKLSKHCSQTDTSKGFGGKFGVQGDRVDKVRSSRSHWALMVRSHGQEKTHDPTHDHTAILGLNANLTIIEFELVPISQVMSFRCEYLNSMKIYWMMVLRNSAFSFGW